MKVECKKHHYFYDPDVEACKWCEPEEKAAEEEEEPLEKWWMKHPYMWPVITMTEYTQFTAAYRRVYPMCSFRGHHNSFYSEYKYYHMGASKTPMHDVVTVRIYKGNQHNDDFDAEMRSFMKDILRKYPLE